jgi:hypothetical protein
MPFVGRDDQGRIIAVHREASQGASEEVSADHPELARFLAARRPPPGPAVSDLAASDLEIVRLIEDLVDVLIDKNLIAFTDLPVGAQKKLLRRKRLREELQGAENIVADEGGVL